MPVAPGSVGVQLVGGPTVLLEIGGLRLLTDPTFDPPGDHPIGERVLVKTAGPAVPAERIGPLDAVLLSHDQHPDNLDTRGRSVLAAAPVAFSTGLAARRLGAPVRALRPWTHAELARPDGTTLRITAVPAQHGPVGTEDVAGPVIGFVLSGGGVPTVYISGDNASLQVAQEVAGNLGPIDVAVLHAGAARTALMDAFITLTSEQCALAARVIGARAVVPVHCEGWAFYTEGPESVRDAMHRHGLADKLVLLRPGEEAAL